MSKKSKITIISLAAAVLIGGAVFLWKSDFNKTKEVGLQNSPKSDLNGFKTYTHPGYGFSFDYPGGWNVSSFAEGEGEVVLIQPVRSQPSGTAAVPPVAERTSNGLQIYISMFDEEETSLTKERILADIPDMLIENDKQIKIANAIDALSFDSANEAGDKTKEVWFVYNSFLYQITAAAGSEATLNTIIQTWSYQ